MKMGMSDLTLCVRLSTQFNCLTARVARKYINEWINNSCLLSNHAKKKDKGLQVHFIYLTTWHLQGTRVIQTSCCNKRIEAWLQLYYRRPTNHSWHSCCHISDNQTEREDNCVKKCQIVKVLSRSAQVSPTQLSITLSLLGVDLSLIGCYRSALVHFLFMQWLYPLHSWKYQRRWSYLAIKIKSTSKFGTVHFIFSNGCW